MKLVRLTKNRHYVINGNQCPIGEIYREVDGYWVFWPYTVTGFFTEEFLRELVGILEKRNRKWNETVKKGLIK